MKLPKVVTIRKKRVGRGVGSGKGSHTSGRGQKGQKARGDIHILFEGLKMKKSFLKRLPLMRGKGKFHGKGKPVILNLSKLESLPSGSKITVELLVKEKLVNTKEVKEFGVKILGGGKTTKKFIFMVPTSKSVAKLGEKVVEKVSEKPAKASK
jgi:large subunit ribosomal protein L15